MRQCEFKKRYDPDMDMHIGKHIYGEGIGDIFKGVGSKIFSKTAAKTAATKAATKTGEFGGNKAGDKIIELLSKKKPAAIQTKPSVTKPKLTQQEVDERVNQILSGGKLRRRNFI